MKKKAATPNIRAKVLTRTIFFMSSVLYSCLVRETIFSLSTELRGFDFNGFLFFKTELHFNRVKGGAVFPRHFDDPVDVFVSLLFVLHLASPESSGPQP